MIGRGIAGAIVLVGVWLLGPARGGEPDASPDRPAPLTGEQRRRLEAALARRYGRVRLNVDVDPEVVGGVRVQVGSELVDGTVRARLDEAHRRLAG